MAHDATPVTSIVIIALATMRIWPDNPRKTLGDITDLTRSIRESGVDQPLIVRELNPPVVVTRGEEVVTLTHEVIDGQRRYHAATEAGSLGVPCIVRVLTDAEALEIALRANDQREPVNALEEAAAIRLRLDDAKAPCTVEQLADRMGRDRRYILRRLSLLGLCETAQSWLRNGTLPLRHAEALAVLDPATQAAHVGRYKDRDIPPYKAFARDLSLALTVLNNAPFDVKDAKLVPRAGACGPCPKNSASQPDLFGGVSDDAHCCDQPCWNAKVEAHWQRETKAAKRKGLAIVEDVIAYGSVTRRDVPYVSAEMLPKGHGQSQTAITRSEFGHVIALYARPSKPPRADDATRTGDDCDDADDDDLADDDIEPESADGGESTSATPREERGAAKQARRVALYRRLLEVLATPEGLRAGLRTALFAAVTEWGGTDLWRCMDVLGLEYHEDTLPEADAAKVPDADVSRVLVVMLVATTLEASPDADMPACERKLRAMLASESPKPATGAEVAEVETDAEAPTHRVLIVPDEDGPNHTKGLPGWNAEKTPGAGSHSGGSCRPLRSLYAPVGHADIEKLVARLDKAQVPYLDLGDVPKSWVFDLAPSNRSVRERWNSAHPARPVTLADEPDGTAPATCVWITEKVWDKLTDDQQGMLSTPDVTTEEVVWEGREGHVMAVVRDAKTLGALQHVLREHKVKHQVLFEGEEIETKRAKKAVKT